LVDWHGDIRFFFKGWIVREELKVRLNIVIWTQIAPMVMLILCVEEWPYFYYVVLRILVCPSAIGAAVIAYGKAEDMKNKIFSYMMWGFTGIFGLVAFLFCPLWPIHLSRDIWVTIDLVTAGLFFISLFVLRFPRDDMD